MYQGERNAAPSDTVTTLSSNQVISNKFFISLCRTYFMNWSAPTSTGQGGILVLGAGEDLTCDNCQLTTSNYSFIQYRDTTSDCYYSFYSITIVDFEINGISLGLSSIFAPSNSFPFTYLGQTFEAGFSSGCPSSSASPNILDSGTSQVVLPSQAFMAVCSAICQAYSGKAPNCQAVFCGEGGWLSSLDGLPHVNILLWDPASSSVVKLLLPPTAYSRIPHVIFCASLLHLKCHAGTPKHSSSPLRTAIFMATPVLLIFPTLALPRLQQTQSLVIPCSLRKSI
jgi:hypothetical protein